MALPNKTHSAAPILRQFGFLSDSSELPPKYTAPFVGVSSAARMCSKVLLPAPDGPTIEIISPRAIEKLTSSRGVISCEPEWNALRRPSTRTSSPEPVAARELSVVNDSDAQGGLPLHCYIYVTLDRTAETVCRVMRLTLGIA